MKFYTRVFSFVFAVILLLSAFPTSITAVSSAEDAGAEAPITDSNATYAPESAHVWTNKTITEGDEIGQYGLNLETWVDNVNLILEENIPLDVVFCIDQSASMYKPAKAGSDLRCSDGFGGGVAGITGSISPAAKEATGAIYRTEFTEMMRDSKNLERAKHIGYYICRVAGEASSSGVWFILNYYQKSNGTWCWRAYRTCRTNQGTFNGATTDGCAKHPSQGWRDWGATPEDFPAGVNRYYVTQYGMMYDAVLSFVEETKANSDKSGVNHRFAFTTFSGYTSTSEKGTSVIVGSTHYTYDAISKITDEAQRDELFSSALLSIRDEADYEKILESVNTIQSDYFGTHTQAGIRLAKWVLSYTKDDPGTEGRKRFVLLFTDGEPNMYFKSSSDPTIKTEEEEIALCKKKAVTEAYTIKKSRTAGGTGQPGLGGQIYTICTTGDEDGEFLKYVSSTYPSAVSLTEPGEAVDRIYYYLESDASNLVNIFAEIRDKELLDRSLLQGNIVMRDVISSGFQISADGVSLYMVPYTGNDTFNEDPSTWIPLDSEEGLTVRILRNAEEYGGNDVIEISGFDYGANRITEADGTTPASGYKLLVQLPISARDEWAAENALPTNDGSDSGIFGEGGKIIGFDGPSVDLPAYIYLKKTVAGEQANPDDAFTFNVTAQRYTEIDGSYYHNVTHGESDGGTGNVLVTRGGNYLQANITETTEEISLKHEEIIEISPLEAGSYVTVREVTTPGYTATVKLEYANGDVETVPPETYADGALTVAVVPGMTIHYINFAYPRPDTVVMDYGLPMQINVLVNDLNCAGGTLVGVGAKMADLTPTTTQPGSGYSTSYTGTYGTFAVQNNALVYTPGVMTMDGVEEVTYVVSQTVDGKHYYFYSTLTVVPATSIYYEDSFVSFNGSWGEKGSPTNIVQSEDRPGRFEFAGYDMDNVYGYDPAYQSCTTYSLESSHYAHVSGNTYSQNGAWPTASFTFTGTGFDLISLTSNQTGFITCYVYQGTAVTDTPYKRWTVDTYYGYTRALDEENPWIKYTGTYDGERWSVTKEAVKLPGNDASVQVPETPQAGDVYVYYEKNYIWTPATGSNPLYQIPVIRNNELPYGTYTVEITAAYIPFFDHTGAGSYDFYLDAVRIYEPAKDMERYYLQDNEAYPQYVELRHTLLNGTDGSISYIDGVTGGTMEDYGEIGPNNEIYLNKNRAMAFSLSGGQALAAIHVGAKTFDGSATLHFAILHGSTTKTFGDISVSSHTDLYYSLTEDYVPAEGDVIVLTNTGDSIVTLTTLKITYASAPTGATTLTINAAQTRSAGLYVQRKITGDEDFSRDLLLSMGHSVNLESDLQMNYRIKRSDLEGYDLRSAYLTVEKDVYPAEVEATVETVSLYPDLTSDPERMIFTFTGLSAAELGSELRAVLHICDSEGKEYTSKVDTFSVRAYAEMIYDRYSYEQQPTLFRLLADVLNYGAAAQRYFGRRTDCLVTEGMEAYLQYATTAYAEVLDDVKLTGEAPAGNVLVSKIGFSVNLASRIELNVKLSLNGAAGDITCVKVADAQGNVLAVLDEFEQLSDGRVQVTYTGIKATQLRQMYYFTAYAGETAVSATTGYSIEACARGYENGSDLALAELIRQCMYYGDSAANYFNQQEGAERK